MKETYKIIQTGKNAFNIETTHEDGSVYLSSSDHETLQAAQAQLDYKIEYTQKNIDKEAFTPKVISEHTHTYDVKAKRKDKLTNYCKNERKVEVIDVGNMSPKEAEETVCKFMDQKPKSKWRSFLEFIGVAGVIAN